MHRIDRRSFQAATTSMALGALGLSKLQAAPSDRLAIGFIGVGTMGRGHLGSFLGMPDVEVVAVSDVVRERLDNAANMVAKHPSYKSAGKQAQSFEDYRKLLELPGLDAVVIATPDHWHALQAVHAAQAGKHIYCEKPLTRTIGDGRTLVKAIAKSGVVFQTGSQQRSEFSGHFRNAVERVRNGLIGKLQVVRIGVGAPAKACDLPGQDIPAGTNWDRWVGPAEFRAYHSDLCPKGVHGHFPAWRAYREYAGGGLADMGAHHFDIAQWALDMDMSGPVKVIPPKDPKAITGLRFVYANGLEMFHGGEADCVFVGEKGTIRVSRGKIEADPMSILELKLPDGGFRAYPSSNHRRNWLESVRQKKECICTAETGHRSASVCHLGNIGYRLGRELTWDPARETFAGDAEAQALVNPPMRAGYSW